MRGFGPRHLAPHASDRAAAVARARALSGRTEQTAQGGAANADPAAEKGRRRALEGAAEESRAEQRPRYIGWAELLRRTFAIDVLACPGCGGRLRLLATIEQGAVVEKILTHLGLATGPPPPAPAREAPWLPGMHPASDTFPPID